MTRPADGALTGTPHTSNRMRNVVLTVVGVLLLLLLVSIVGWLAFQA